MGMHCDTAILPLGCVNPTAGYVYRLPNGSGKFPIENLADPKSGKSAR